MDNWLINVLALVLLCVVLDGARRAYLKHRDTMKVSRNLSRSMRADLDFDDEDDALSSPRPVPTARNTRSESPKPRSRQNESKSSVASTVDAELEYIDPEEAEKRRQIAAELPGSVRVVQRRKPEDASQINRKVQQNFQSSRKPLAGSKPVRPDQSEVSAPSEADPVTSRLAEPDNTPGQEPQQVSLNLEEQVPTLMDSVVEEAPEPGSQAVEPELPGLDATQAEPGPEHESDGARQNSPLESLASQTSVENAVLSSSSSSSTSSSAGGSSRSVEAAEPPSATTDVYAESAAEDRREPSLDESVSLESLQQVPASAQGEETGESPEALETKSQSGWASADLKLPEFKMPEFKRRAARDAGKPETSGNISDSRSGKQKPRGGKSGPRGTARERSVEEVLILNIMAPAGDYFEGNDLLRVLLSSGLRFGDMNIFHYHCGEAGEGPVLFSLANIVVPGTFDMSTMEDFTTPGISLFLALPAEVEALKALDTLLGVAREISAQLGGELKDENRSVFTAQTAEHYRQRVMEFRRRKALAQAQA
ncbi:cell division protein ZipA [Microbulbifer celer]|uniref:Cell division protein ZipA n=1 Tax=Microbulbifer celer TaxID=435905 RepID=A0ABW3UC67_9GAMM|nr:cell division protein ZipA [Microbulbifer celer]UFN59097.1 cell division protein ZipA [Microbulbifer celer]